MAAERHTKQLGLFDGPAWPRDDPSDSDFELDSSLDSPVLSSSNESAVSDDLDLYDQGCVC